MLSLPVVLTLALPSSSATASSRGPRFVEFSCLVGREGMAGFTSTTLVGEDGPAMADTWDTRAADDGVSLIVKVGKADCWCTADDFDIAAALFPE